MTTACRIFGHQPEFRAAGSTMSWQCRRCGGDSGSKRYPSAQAAERYAAAFNRRDAAIWAKGPR